jgi:ornithine decarboxylase
MDHIKPYYAIKSNPDTILIDTLKNNTEIGFDVASIKEIDKTSKYLYTNDIIYSNPCKTQNEILHAKKSNIKLLVVDHISELEKIYELYPTCEIIIRIQSVEKFSQITFNSKFGSNYLGVDKMLNYINKNKMIFKGFSYHVGSKCDNMIAHKLTLETIKNTYMPLVKKYNQNISIINIGGGFTDYKDLINFREINLPLVKHFNNDCNISMMAEPGRYFSQNYLSLIATIKSIREIDNIYKITINDSIYHTFNGIINDKQSFNPILINDTNNNVIVKSIIFGQTCDSGDIINKDLFINLPKVGDKLLYQNILEV